MCIHFNRLLKKSTGIFLLLLLVPVLFARQPAALSLVSNNGLEGVYLSMMTRGDNGMIIKSNSNQTDPFFLPAVTPIIIPDEDKSFDIIFQQQRNLNISTSVMPPYTSDFLQYYDKVRVILSSSVYTNLSLKLTLTGNNGITIATSPDYVPSQFIELNPNVPEVLTGQDLWDYFNDNNLVFSGISKQEVMDKGLPEGTYRLCFRAYDRDGILLSGSDPIGCSSPFSLQLFEPPGILSPICGDTIKQPSGQPLLFAWTPSPGAPPGTPYTLMITEMNDPDASPGDALLTATTPAFFETTVLGTSFLYGPVQPVLEKGKKYAFQVIAGTEALDISNPFDFDAAKLRFKNKGKSAPCYFIYGKPESFQVFPLITTAKNNGPTFSQIQPDPKILPYSTVTGQLNYKFKSTRFS